MPKKFQRKIEDFTCEHCGARVKGNGYTNHCPDCLWSKHVDNNPGDRENRCKGLMEPVDAYLKATEWYILHKCTKCGQERSIKTIPSDNQQAIKDLLAKKITG